MPPVGFKLTISVGERPQTYALDRAPTGTSIYECYAYKVFYKRKTIVKIDVLTFILKLFNIINCLHYFLYCTIFCMCNIHVYLT